MQLTRKEVIHQVFTRLADTEKKYIGSFGVKQGCLRVLRDTLIKLEDGTSRDEILDFLRTGRNNTNCNTIYREYSFAFRTVSAMYDSETPSTTSAIQKLSKQYKLSDSVIRIAIEDAQKYGDNRVDRALSVLAEYHGVEVATVKRALKDVEQFELLYMGVPHTNNQWYRIVSDGCQITTTANKRYATAVPKKDWLIYFSKEEIEKYSQPERLIV